MNEKLKSEELDHLFQAILCLNTLDECYSFFEDLCTVKEMISIGQRLEVAWRLCHGQTYLRICEETGASTATISRVNRCLRFGNDSYANIFRRMDELKENLNKKEEQE